jgi:Tfp pilus assembly protein PilV
VLAVLAVGVGLLVVMAIVVGILDAAQAAAWRAIAAQRRQLGEARRRSSYLIDGGDD